MRFSSIVMGISALVAGMTPVSVLAEVQFRQEYSFDSDAPVNSDISTSLADYDADGDLDVLVQGSSNSRRLLQNRLIEDGTLSFVNVTSTAGPVASDTTGWSAAWADMNGDGFVDLFLGEANPGSARGDFFLNREGPDGRFFENVSATTIDEPGFHQNVAWADMNNDRLLDLVIGMEGPEEHEIYLQGEGFTFTPVGAEVGIQVPFGTKSYGCAVADPDKDGDLDIYISTCRNGGNIRNNFFLNDLVPGGTLSFTDVADTNGTQYLPNSYHAEFQDFDNDGWLDLFMVGADGNNSKIWRNNTDGSWTDVNTILGGTLLSHNGGDFNGGKAIDYDNDGDLDLFFHDHLPDNGMDRARSLFRNDGDWVFVDVTADTTDGANGLLQDNQRAYDSSWGDIDNDGDMDLIAATGFGLDTTLLLSNATEENGNWSLMFRLRGEEWNTTAIGATITGTLRDGEQDEVTLTRMMNAQAGTFNQSDTPVHFGLGDTETLYNVTVNWPGGPERNYGDFDASARSRGEIVYLDFPPPVQENVKNLWQIQ